MAHETVNPLFKLPKPSLDGGMPLAQVFEQRQTASNATYVRPNEPLHATAT
jgi:hypothetical protein